AGRSPAWHADPRALCRRRPLHVRQRDDAPPRACGRTRAGGHGNRALGNRSRLSRPAARARLELAPALPGAHRSAQGDRHGGGGAAENLRDGANARLFAPGATGALAAAVRRLADDPALRARLREGGIATARRHTADAFNAAVADELERAVSGRA